MCIRDDCLITGHPASGNPTSQSAKAGGVATAQIGDNCAWTLVRPEGLRIAEFQQYVLIVLGPGGIEMNPVQGAARAGASVVVGVDPVEMKRTASLQFGATQVVATMQESTEIRIHPVGPSTTCAPATTCEEWSTTTRGRGAGVSGCSGPGHPVNATGPRSWSGRVPDADVLDPAKIAWEGDRIPCLARLQADDSLHPGPAHSSPSAPTALSGNLL
jgi:hypothetical protein